MPAVNPRISVSVTPPVDALLLRLSRVTGQSKSAIIGGLVETTIPVLQQLADVPEAAVIAKDEMHIKVLENLVSVQAQMGDLLGAANQLFGDATAPLVHAEEDAEASEAAYRSELASEDRMAQTPPRPPYVTRGSGTPKSPPQTSNPPMKAASSKASSKNTPAKPPKRPATASKAKVGG